MFVLFLISRYFVGDVWGKGGYNWYRDSWGWWMILAILTSHTFSSWPPQLGSQAAQMTELCIFCPKSLSSAVISPRSDLTQSGQIETTPSSGQRVLMTSNYWSQELESESWPLQSKQEHRHRVKQSQLSSMPAVLWLFLPCSMQQLIWLILGCAVSPVCSMQHWWPRPRPAGCAGRVRPGSVSQIPRGSLRAEILAKFCNAPRKSGDGQADTTIRFRCLALALFSPPIGPVSAGQPIRGGWRRW